MKQVNRRDLDVNDDFQTLHFTPAPKDHQELYLFGNYRVSIIGLR